ncbi:MAG: hypothetical protein NC344_09255 [Bacteroidales bacterium]|nr:hypothetical protein [Bacteroidales bacterium]MCM1147996.1 hypothetical protein [Bacteroidales bacterium]MCM1206920.1 hypothetical protein [Bacillota bacterium]MCM1509554.1 hypothetical protein [Clostridium sp.]
MAKKKVEVTETNVVSEQQMVVDAEKKKTPAKRTTRKKATKNVEDTAIEDAASVESKPKRTVRKKTVKTVGETEVESASQELSVEEPVEKSSLENVGKTEEAEPRTPAEKKQEQKPIPPCPTLLIKDVVDLVNAPQRQLLLNDQQIQQLTVEEAEKRFRWIEGTLALVLNYDVVLSDTNIWIELLTGHTSSNSDPRFNARLQFERQLEFISKLSKFRGGRFSMMSETYEEIDRFATQMEPPAVDADMKDENVCRNIAARLAKRLILSQQRENRLRIEGIGAESHHSAFADPAIIRRCVELFAQGKKVLLLTNDASVAIRSMGMCDDLQRTNGIDDETWDAVYAPLRPMVMTFDDLKVLDAYTRQYHFLQMTAGKQWMEDVPQRMEKRTVTSLELWTEGFRPGDRHSDKQNNKQKQGNGNDQKGRGNSGQKQKQNTQEQKKETVKQPQKKQETQKKPVEVKSADNSTLSAVQDETGTTAEEQADKKAKHRGGRRSGRKQKTQPQETSPVPQD